VAEIAQVLLGEVAGRTSEQDITAYKSLGNASQDLSIGHEALVQAHRLGLANTIEFHAE
jgi:ornithine cyclodeaminase